MTTLNICTQLTRPSSPSDGDLLYETDTQKMICWDGSAWQEWQADSSTVAGDWIIVKDNWKDAGRPTSSNHWDATRIDSQGASYGYGYALSGSGLSQMTNHTNYDAQDTTSEYNLSSFQSAGADDIIIDAIRFRCKRPSGGLGYFSVGKLFFVKGAGTYNRNTPSVRNWFSGITPNQGSPNVYEVNEDWHKYANQHKNYVWGYRGNIQSTLSDGDVIGSQFNTTSTDYTWNGSNHMYSGDHIVENDPSGSLDNKTSGSKWMIRTGANQRQDEDDGITFQTILNSSISSSKLLEQYSYGISAGINSPSELYFTLFFAEPLNLTNLEAMHYNLDCDQMDSEISFEFRKRTNPVQDWKVIKDNYGADSYTHKYDGSAFAGTNNAQIGAFNTKRLDPDGAAYHHTESWPNSNYISSTTSSPYNLSSLQSSDSDLYTARAMRFRCKRPEGGAGFFSIWHFAMLKGASGHGGAFRNVANTHYSSIQTYIETQNEAGHVIGYNTYNGMHKVDGSNFGTSFFPSGKDEWVCKTDELFGDPAGCRNPDFDDSQNRGLAFFKDTDPTSEGIASKTDGSDWIRTPSYGNMSFVDSSHTTRTFNTALLGMFTVDHANYMPTFGIKVGSGAPAELYFTFFFASPMNITNLEGITWNPRCDQAGSEVSIEFLMT